MSLPHEADSSREDPPAAYELQQEAVSCSLWPCCTVPRLFGAKKCLWYCWEGAAGAEFRQLQSSQGIVSAWAPAAPELDADETLSPKPSRIGLGLEQALHSPLSPHFPQQQTPYWTLPLPFTSFRPLELFQLPPTPPPHCYTCVLYRWHGGLHSITLHSFTLYYNRDPL